MMRQTDPATRVDGVPGGAASAWDAAASRSGSHYFRPDIEGLRAVAILAVLAYHAGIPGIVGGFVGVDVFFVISGFLITGLLMREIATTGGLDLASFYARRARRLLPAALVVIVATVAASWLVLSSIDLPSVADDGAAAALYVSNYRFALNAIDYFAADLPPSPLLHYWSLAVEEQFYLLWPLVILIGARLLGTGRLWWLIGLVAVVSFALCVVVTDLAQPWAFYSLPTRAWQLALGALLALGMLELPALLGPRLVGMVSIGGIALIVAGVLLIDANTPVPGVAALLPAGGAALLIASGAGGGAIAGLLAASPMRWIGRISYSLYLWHWPILILVPQLIDSHSLPVRIVLAGVSIVVADISTRVIEEPFRFGAIARLTSRRTLAMAAAGSAIVFVTTVLAGGWSGRPTTTPFSLPSGALSANVAPSLMAPVLEGQLPPDLQPTLREARASVPRLYRDGCRAETLQTVPVECVYGDPESATSVVL